MLMCLLLLCSAEPDLTRLVERLQSDDFDTREAATKALMRLPRAEGILEKAALTDDADLKKRIETIVRDLTRQRVERAIRRGTLLVTAGNADLLPDLMRTFQPHDPKNKLFGALVLLSADLAMRERTFATTRNLKPDGFHYPLEPGAKDHLFQHPCIFSFRHVTNAFYRQPIDAFDFLIFTGSAFSRGTLSRCVVLADSLSHEEPYHSFDGIAGIVNGDVNTKFITHSVVICDNLLTATPTDSLCIARQSIRQKDRNGIHPVPRGKPVFLVGKHTTLHVPASGKRSFGLIRFFEVADVGLTLDACKVTKVAGPLAKAGVKPGDVFTHVDGVAVKDAEALRKVLRRRYAILGYGAFTLTREGKPLTVVAELDE